MKYIDAHIHLGDCRVFDLNITEEELLNALEKHRIDAAIVQPFPGASDYKDVHERIYKLSLKYPGHIYGLVSVNPHMPKDEYESIVKHYVVDYGFVGIKLHTIGHAINPLSKDAHTVYEVAAKLNVPVNIHTGIGLPFSVPSLCIPVANEYPELTFVIAHSGTMMLTSEAILAAQMCSNIFLDTTWCCVEDIPYIVDAVGSDRIVFASDSLKNIGLEIEKYILSDLSQKQQQEIFYKNASSIFNIKSVE